VQRARSADRARLHGEQKREQHASPDNDASLTFLLVIFDI